MGGVSHGITTGTAMVETPVELVDSASQGILAIDKIALALAPSLGMRCSW